MDCRIGLLVLALALVLALVLVFALALSRSRSLLRAVSLSAATAGNVTVPHCKVLTTTYSVHCGRILCVLLCVVTIDFHMSNRCVAQPKKKNARKGRAWARQQGTRRTEDGGAGCPTHFSNPPRRLEHALIGYLRPFFSLLWESRWVAWGGTGVACRGEGGTFTSHLVALRW